MQTPTISIKDLGTVAQIVGVAFAVGVVLFTKLLPWLRTKRSSRSLHKKLGPIFTKSQIERAIKYYIPPRCQSTDPAGAEEPRLVIAVYQPLFEVLDSALKHPTEYRYLIILADSGMGKTSALINYCARHIRRWRRSFEIALVPLGIPDADARIAAIPDKPQTVLFLDAFDEDTLAIVDHVERLRMLIAATRDFHRVVMTCRTQFFSREEEIPQRTGITKVASRAAGEPAEYYFHKIYLSPFSDKEVARYLRRRYPLWLQMPRFRARRMVEKIPNLSVRPMLLAHVDDLIGSRRTISFSYELYEEMVEAWIAREKGFVPDENSLRQFSEALAVDLFINRVPRGGERVSKEELRSLAAKWGIELDHWALTGRSLLNRDGEGNFKFAHRSIMEYLFMRQAARGMNEQCFVMQWTDQMKTFFWELFHLDSLSEDFFAVANLSPSRRDRITDLFRSSSETNLAQDKLYVYHSRLAHLVTELAIELSKGRAEIGLWRGFKRKRDFVKYGSIELPGEISSRLEFAKISDEELSIIRQKGIVFGYSVLVFNFAPIVLLVVTNETEEWNGDWEWLAELRDKA